MSITRTFRDLKDVDGTEQLSMLTSIGWSRGLSWAELLKSERIMIVSEAGAGKSFECRAQRDRLWAAGEPAFYVDLASLKDSSLRDLLSGEEEARLDGWLSAQSDTATFFLDSIDELELTLGKFENALKRFAKAISGHLGRAKVVITSRPIPIDQRVFEEQLPIPLKAEEQELAEAFADVAMRRTKKQPQSGDEPPPWRNVALLPLSDAQILEMARVQGVTDPEAMLADIRQRDAQEFARRPQDLIELCVDWKDNRRIRNHAEQVAHNIRTKLKPRPPSERHERAPLDEDKALEGASRLALAALLTRRLTLRHSADADSLENSEAALDPSAILTTWTADERATLLERALFGFATYGRVRFHHRSVIEFLAAERLDNRLSAGMSIRAVKRLLFADTVQGQTVIRSSMKPVAAWMAARRDSIFAAVRDIEPSVLLDFGDPASLSVQQRAGALRAYVQRYGTGGWRGLDAPHLQVHRFASPELWPEVKQLWSTGIENPEVRSLLLNLVAAAKMADCSDLAHAEAVDPAADTTVRIDAVEALIALEDVRLHQVASCLENGASGWPTRLVKNLIARMFPRHLSPDQLCRVLKQLSGGRRSVGDLSSHLPYLIADEGLSSADLRQVRQCLTDLVMEDVSWNAQLDSPVSRRDDLLPALTAACTRQWREDTADAGLAVASIRALRLPRRHYESDEQRTELRQSLLGASASYRETAFWADDALMQQLRPLDDPWKRFAQIAARDGLHLTEATDWDWITAAAADTTRPLSEREMMIHAAYWVLSGDGWREKLAALRPQVEDQPTLLALLEKRLEPTKPDPAIERMKKANAKRRRQERRRQARARKSWVQFWNEVATKPNELFAEERASNTAWNLWQVMERSGERSRASGWNRRFLEGHFGRGVADRLRVTLMKAWRNDKPTLRSERKADEKNRYLVRWQLGVAAIAAEAEDPDWAKKLSLHEARLAARYAPIELNGFPGWLESLAIHQPAAVDATLGNELSLELAEPAVTDSHSMLLQNISYAPADVAKVFLGRLRQWLDDTGGAVEEGENPQVGADRLARGLEVLISHGDDTTIEQLQRLAQCQLSRGPSLAYARVWLPALMRLLPAAGAERLEQVLDALPVEQEGEAIGWFATLFGERHRAPVSLSHPDFSPAILLRLVRLAYSHIRHSDDLRHEGSYSPGLRDNAQDARNALFSALVATRGPEAWAAKLELARDPMLAHLKDRLFALARDRLAEEADDITLDYDQIRKLDQQGEAPPTTRDAMFALLRDRLDDLDDLLLQDTSPREGWAAFGDEKILRRAIAHELRRMSNEAYKVDQEAVTADEKETDIRLRSTGGPQEATIELKIGEKDRSARALRNALGDQLVRKYMAAETCRSGCLLISVATDRTWQHPEMNQSLTFEELIAFLNEEAAKIMLEAGGELRLLAKGLDLRPRLPTEKRGKGG